jgi:poly-gamma-glutamate synthesis protein (capsule biosynthesis protein)
MLAFLLACHADEPLTPTGDPAVALARAGSEERGSARIVATGDLLIHKSVQDAARDNGGYEALFAGVKPLIAGADLAFANLETPVAPLSGKPIGPFEFNAPPDLLPALVSTGFDLVSFANNHVYDQGRPGLVETMDQLERAHLAWVGAGRTCADARKARVVEIDGLKVALLGTSQLYNAPLNASPDEPCAAEFDEDAILREVKAARAAGADAVVLSIHWGTEYVTAPSADQVATAHRLLEGGADLILGHHPHVLAPIEVVHTADGRVAVVAYSLGNFVSNQSAWYEPGLNPPTDGNPRDGVLLSVRLVRKRYGPSALGVTADRVELADLVATPLWTLNNGPTRGADPPRISVEPLASRILAARAALASASTPAEVAAAGADLDEMERRWKQLSAILGDRFLPPPP